ncbi:MAG: hypothetical protein GY951_06990 [Psychromonas sp.]|nr:hypothetical protein [Alteromonadales bacterium]MCP5077788.1 hypothetical protein [Psychromonas sp.]
MSAKKHKRKAVNHNHHSKNKHLSSTLLSRYPRLFLTIGLLLVLVAILLLSIGYVSDARVGLSMISLFTGVVMTIFANAALPKP